MSNARSERGACEMHFSITLLYTDTLQLINTVQCSCLQSQQNGMQIFQPATTFNIIPDKSSLQ